MSTSLVELQSGVEQHHIETTLRDPDFWRFATEQFAEQPPKELMTEASKDDSLDLQSGKVSDLKETRDKLLEMLMERPSEAFIQEVTYLAATCYEARMQHSEDGSTFYTRDSNAPRLDSLTTISDSQDGTMTVFRHRMYAPATYSYDNPVEIIASTEGDFVVLTEVYEKGIERMKEVKDKATIKSIMREYFTSSLRAAGAVEGRTPDENALADKDAMERYDKMITRIKFQGGQPGF